MYFDDESIARCHAGTVVDAEGAFRDLIYHMHRHRSVNVFKAAMVDVVVRAVAGLFGGLEKEFYSAFQLVK